MCVRVEISERHFKRTIISTNNIHPSQKYFEKNNPHTKNPCLRCHRQPPECSSEVIRAQTAFDPNVCKPPVLTEEQPLLRASAAYTLFTWACHHYSNASI